MATHIGGYIEQVFAHHVTGWAADLENASDIVVQLNRDGRVLARTLPAFARCDVEAALGARRPAGFHLIHEDVRQLLQDGAFIEAGSDPSGYVRLATVEGAFEAKAGSYQDFGGDEAGSSRSRAKLEALQLQFLEHLKPRGARVLDLGCNEGFFCDAVARRLDAACVLGVDSDRDCVERARARFPQFEFRHQS